MKMMILKITEGTEFDVMPAELQAAVLAAKVQWPESRLPGTVPVSGSVLILILAAPTRAQLQAQIDAFGLPWEVLAHENEPVNQAALLPYFADVVTFDENDEPISTPVTDIAGKLQTWAGRQWAF